MLINPDDIVSNQNEIDELKTKISKGLTASRPIVNKFLVSQYRQRRLTIEINPDIQSSDSYVVISPDPVIKKINYKIYLAIGTIDQGILERKQFDYRSFNDDELLEYRLLQQISKCIYNELLLKNNSNLKSLITIATSQNQTDRRFFTMLGSYSAATTSTNGFEDDIAELLAMYLWDSKYFTRFIKYTLDPDLEETRKMFAVRTQNISTGNVMLNLVETIVNSI